MKPYTKYSERLHLPFFKVADDVELIASSFALVEPIDDLNPRFLEKLLIKCLIKVGWSQEHFVNVLQSQLDSNVLEPHGVVALAVIGI